MPRIIARPDVHSLFRPLQLSFRPLHLSFRSFGGRRGISWHLDRPHPRFLAALQRKGRCRNDKVSVQRLAILFSEQWQAADSGHSVTLNWLGLS